MQPRVLELELSSASRSSLGLPAHVGCGDAAIVRTTRSESLFDVLTKLREDNTDSTRICLRSQKC